MATYTRATAFTPSSVSSTQPGLSIFQKQADLMARGEAMVRSKYKNILDLSLTHEPNQEKLNSFLKEATTNLNHQIQKDLSNYNNVQDALGIFDPLTTDPQYRSIMMDHKYTKHYQEQFNIADQYKTQKNKDGIIGANYAEVNERELYQKFNEFKSSDSNSPESWGSAYEFQPYYNNKEEERTLTKEFLDLPDEHTEERMDPNTGVITKITFKGKTADQIRKYLNLNMSEQAKSQILLEGRVASRNIKPDQYITSIQEKNIQNLKTLKEKLNDLESGKITTDEAGKKLTPKGKQDLKNNILAQMEEQEQLSEKLTNEDEIKKIIANKESAYSSTFLNDHLNSVATTTVNRRYDLEFDTNSAQVKYLDRSWDKARFSAQMDFNYDALNAEIKANQQKFIADMAAQGLKPDGTPLGGTLGDGLFEQTVPSDIEKQEDFDKQYEEANKTYDEQIRTFASKNTKLLIDMGLVPSALDEQGNIRPESTKKALTMIYQAVYDIDGNTKEYQRIMGMTPEQLKNDPQAAAKKELYLNIDKQGDALQMNYKFQKSKINYKKQIANDLAEEIKKNPTLTTTDIITGMSAAGFKVKSVEEAAQLAVKDRRAARALSNIAGGSESYGEALDRKAGPVSDQMTWFEAVSNLGSMVSSTWDRRSLYDNIQDQVKQRVKNDFYSVKTRTRVDIPQSIETQAAKAQRDYVINNKIAPYLNKYKLQGLGGDEIKNLSVDKIIAAEYEDGKMRFEYYKSNQYNSDGKLKTDAEPTKSEWIPDSDLQFTRTKDVTIMNMLSMDGEYKGYTRKIPTNITGGVGNLPYSKYINIPFKIETFNGDKLTVNANNPEEYKYPLKLKMDITGTGVYEEVPLPNNGKYSTPTDLLNVASLYANNVFEKMLNIALKIAPKATVEERKQIIKDLYKKYRETGEIKELYGLENEASEDANFNLDD